MIQPREAGKLFDRFSQLSYAPGPQKGLPCREAQVLQLIAMSAANKEIANELPIGENTLRSHIMRIFNYLGVKRPAPKQWLRP